MRVHEETLDLAALIRGTLAGLDVSHLWGAVQYWHRNSGGAAKMADHDPPYRPNPGCGLFHGIDAAISTFAAFGIIVPP
jgi:hypothetical protein